MGTRFYLNLGITLAGRYATWLTVVRPRLRPDASPKHRGYIESSSLRSSPLRSADAEEQFKSISHKIIFL